MAKQFEWLSDSCYPRKGSKLEKGKKYNCKDYPPLVVAEWVKTRAAKYVEDDPKPKTEEKKKLGG